MLEWARELADLYDEMFVDIAGQPQIRGQIRAVVAAIDAWSAASLPDSRSGPMRGTESLGAVVARLVEAHVLACWVLTHLPSGDARIHQMWVQVAELRDAYDDLISAVTHGRIELPRSYVGIEEVEPELRGEYVRWMSGSS
ncbi:hypothetical protein [Nocardia cyriacigeorgica]|uniref:hypothetical protein n=1 Tax=Nocardia cyriacigeorgica TaxID=135487 RepID=UPI0018945EB4|nr:hypothetical protein [Nocardia cyriacigeorgica]MBF6416864.1 hypothetical protein [Nocardia cyriacigeorgica]